jgi:adenylate kinase
LLSKWYYDKKFIARIMVKKGEKKPPIAVFVLGRPGAGKDTQADILAEKLGLFRVSTGDLLKAKIYGSDAEKDPGIQKEKEIFESGVLGTPSWVLGIVKEFVSKMAEKDFEGKNGLVFSSSPRTLYESENLLPFLADIFSKSNMFPIFLDVPESTGTERIEKRNIKTPRTTDTGDEKLKIRAKEFEERTMPAIEYFEEFGIELIKINGANSVKEVSRDILQAIKNKV